MEVGDKIPSIVQTEVWALRASRKILLLLFKKKKKEKGRIWHNYKNINDLFYLVEIRVSIGGRWSF